jgi:WbqC-like protein family
MKTACVFSISLFPPAYMIERIRRSDIVIIVSDRIVDDKNRVNRCMIRTAMDRFWTLTIPVVQQYLPADETEIDKTIEWHDKMMKDVSRGYMGLAHANVAQNLAKHCFDGCNSQALIDWLLLSFLRTLDLAGFGNKLVHRGDSHQRRRYSNDSEFLLNMCLETEADRLIVGRTQKINLNQRLFQRNQVELDLQNWYGNKFINSRDSILDIVARYGTNEIDGLFT